MAKMIVASSLKAQSSAKGWRDRSEPDGTARQLFMVMAGMLAAVGTLMVYSSSMTSQPSEFEQVYLSRHLSFLAAAFVAGGVASQLPASFWRRYARWLFLATVVLLVAVLIPGIGTKVNGARRWIRVAAISIQPSETAKLTVPLLLASCLSLSARGYYGQIIRVLAPVLIVAVLIAREPDLGTATFISLLAAVTLFLARWPLWNFAVGALAAGPAAVLLVAMKPYQLERIEGFIAVWRDFAQAPYQIRQSLTALGTGGTCGTGLGTGWQKLSFLPEANTDFVFAVIGEELGLVGTLAVAGLWLGFLFTGMRVLAHLPRSSFEYVAGTALLVQLVLQAAVNVAVVTAMLPPKGISHPFISYGGSNLMVSVVAVGMILSLSRTDGQESLLIEEEMEELESEDDRLDGDEVAGWSDVKGKAPTP